MKSVWFSFSKLNTNEERKKVIVWEREQVAKFCVAIKNNLYVCFFLSLFFCLWMFMCARVYYENEIQKTKKPGDRQLFESISFLLKLLLWCRRIYTDTIFASTVVVILHTFTTNKIQTTAGFSPVLSTTSRQLCGGRKLLALFWKHTFKLNNHCLI